MDYNIVIRTLVPILLLIVLGFFSRKIGLLKSGDERVLNAYIYYFALPALFMIDLAERNLIENLRFIIAGIIPVFVVLTIYIVFHLIFRFSKDTLYLLIISTIFGSTSFFGIPFITFAFPTSEVESLATLSSASISLVSVTTSITILELYKLEKSTVWNEIRRVAKRLSKNPLMISIFSGVALSLPGIKIFYPISAALHMLGSTTSTVAIFMLGVFLYGRKYTNILKAFELSLLRVVFLPVMALSITTLFHLPSLEGTIVVLMHGMPVAISMMILSERYDFFKETIATLILVSSIGAGLYLNLWLLLLGHR